MTSPYKVTEDFERALADYTGAPYVCAVNSCSAALLLCLKWCRAEEVELPRHTYVSVPNAVVLAGARVRWRDEGWRGVYQLKPYPVWDSARRFTSGMYLAGQFQCVSFATTKVLGLEQGGAILHDDPKAHEWLKRMRFDGRTEGVDPREDTFDMVGHHCIMLPSTAAALTLKLHHLPKENADLPDYPYPDLSQHGAWT